MPDWADEVEGDDDVSVDELRMRLGGGESSVKRWVMSEERGAKEDGLGNL
jgi:hypothetical protein